MVPFPSFARDRVGAPQVSSRTPRDPSAAFRTILYSRIPPELPMWANPNTFIHKKWSLLKLIDPLKKTGFYHWFWRKSPSYRRPSLQLLEQVSKRIQNTLIPVPNPLWDVSFRVKHLGINTRRPACIISRKGDHHIRPSPLPIEMVKTQVWARLGTPPVMSRSEDDESIATADDRAPLLDGGVGVVGCVFLLRLGEFYCGCGRGEMEGRWSRSGVICSRRRRTDWSLTLTCDFWTSDLYVVGSPVCAAAVMNIEWALWHVYQPITMFRRQKWIPSGRGGHRHQE